MTWSAAGSDSSSIVEDIRAIISNLNELEGADLKRGFDILLNATRLSAGCVTRNPLELSFQLSERLIGHHNRNTAARPLLRSLPKHAAVP